MSLTPVSLQFGFVLEILMLIEDVYKGTLHSGRIGTLARWLWLESGLVYATARMARHPTPSISRISIAPAETSMKDFDILVSDLQFLRSKYTKRTRQDGLKQDDALLVAPSEMHDCTKATASSGWILFQAPQARNGVAR